MIRVNYKNTSSLRKQGSLRFRIKSGVTGFFVSLFLVTFSAHAGEPFALVELYTSQGCSSCPSADRLLRELTALAEKENQPIYTLSFHVDYWDGLGWQDPYSKPKFSQRQRAYARVWQAPNVYTPQMIINGKYGFTGSRADLARKYIDQVLQENPRYDLTISFIEAHQGSVDFQVMMSDGIGGHALHAAVVEKAIKNKVPRGENHGRVLSHAHVVRSFLTLTEENMPERLTAVVPQGVDINDATLIVYLQNQDTLEVLAADQQPLIGE